MTDLATVVVLSTKSDEVDDIEGDGIRVHLQLGLFREWNLKRIGMVTLLVDILYYVRACNQVSTYNKLLSVRKVIIVTKVQYAVAAIIFQQIYE